MLFGAGGDPAIFHCSHVLMKRFFDGTDQVNSKTQGGKGQIRKIQKNKKERMEERKIRDFFNFFLTYVEVPILVRVFSISWERPRARSGKFKKTRRKEWKKEK
jgi:hypothetical protein